MPKAETLAEGGDADLDREAEIARLEAHFAHSYTYPEGEGPGEIRITEASRYGGHLILSRSGVVPSRGRPGPEQFLG